MRAINARTKNAPEDNEKRKEAEEIDKTVDRIAKKNISNEDKAWLKKTSDDGRMGR